LLALVELARELDASGSDAAAETATETPDEPAVRPKRQRDSHPGRRALPAELPREEIRLRPEQTDCTECGKGLHAIRDERTELLEWVPATSR